MTTKPPEGRYHTDEQLKELAKYLVANQVFCSDQCRSAEDVGFVFMAVTLADKKLIDKWKKANVVHFYEFNKNAGPRGFNGYPIFTSARALTRADYERLREYEEKLRNAMGAAL